MRQRIVAALALVLAFAVWPASAQECRELFVGDWTVILKTGQTYVGHHLPNGALGADCALCTTSGTWTCQGNTIFKKVGWSSYSGTISADGNTITEPCCILTRIGPAPAARQDVAQCSAEDVRNARDLVRQAELAEPIMRREPNYNNWAIVDDNYRQAANLWRKCGLTGSESVEAQRKRVRDLYSELIERRRPNPKPPSDDKKCDERAAVLKQFESGMGERWVKDQLTSMGCL